MTSLWSQWGLECNEGLLRVWEQLHSELNRTVQRGETWARQRAFREFLPDSEATPPQWTVLTPETGTGKTKGMCVYCSLLPKTVGATIVVELIESAKEVAKCINELAQEDRAIAIYRDMQPQVSAEQAAKFQVLVMTHSAFTRSLEAQALTERHGASHDKSRRLERWHTLESWNGHLRQLTVVDECFPVFGFADLGSREVGFLLNDLPANSWNDYPEVKRSLGFLQDLFAQADELHRSHTDNGLELHPHVFWCRQPGEDWSKGNSELRSSVEAFARLDVGKVAASVRFDQTLVGSLKSGDPQDTATRSRNRIGRWLRSAQALLQRFILLSPANQKRQLEALFSTSWSLMPDNAPPLVILDATGWTNPTYRLLPTRIVVAQRPAQARRYNNVTLHVARVEHGLGKTASNRHVENFAPSWFASLRAACKVPVLCVCHKDSKPTLAKYVPTEWVAPLGPLDRPDQCLVHWGSFAGSNKHRDFAAVAFYSLLYPRRRNIELSFNASQGVQPIGWFADGSARKFQDWPDVVKASELRHLVVELVQAINRTRSRQPINEHGDCRPVDVFLPIPRGKFGEEILGLVKEHLPGVRITSWKLDYAASRKAQPNYSAAVEVAIRDLPPGRTSAKEVWSLVGCKKKRREKLVADMRSEGTSLNVACSESGVTYVTTGAGRGRTCYFLREEVRTHE
jgi:hypothetical protein